MIFRIFGGREISSAKEEAIVDLLMRTGVSKNIARTLVVLATRGETTSLGVEKAAGLRQPEVSISMKELRARGWVKKRDIKKEGKGRPLHSYILTKPFEKIVEELAKAERRRIKAIEETVRQLQKEAKAFSSP